jgi:phosphoribosyl-ATP pyrophosphohydrolase/phosphoribosyl-AMP cyclohydrolase
MRDRNAPLTPEDLASLDWAKMDGLVPAVVQDSATLQVLMLGYMDEAALRRTLDSGLVTFFSRSKGRLWTKGESSGNHLRVQAVFADCDGDALLIRAEPRGPTCHLGTDSCFTAEGPDGVGWLARLAQIVHQRAGEDSDTSYTARLLQKGPKRIAQKVGEEGVEIALAAAVGDRDECIEEASDLLYHLTVLMEARGFGWDDVTKRLMERHKG